MITAVFGFGYPLVMTGFAQVAFKSQANGSLIKVDGKVVGSKLAAQEFTEPEVLPRAPVGDVARLQRGGDDASPTSGPTNPDLAKNVKAAAAGDPEARGPVQPGPDDPRHPGRRGHDLGLGHRPRHLARLRAAPGARAIAAVRHLPLATVQQLISKHTIGRSWGFFGEPGVNVLELNLALDQAGSS